MAPRGRAYLDFNATAPLRPEVLRAVAESLALHGNPSSIHAEGRQARRRLERARLTVASALAVVPDRVIFTSGGTEANHLAVLGLPGPRLVSAIEHPSVLEADPSAERASVDASGRLDLKAFAAQVSRLCPRLISIMLANNETGAVQPVREAARIAHAQGTLVHCDAVQAFGKLSFTLADLEADLVTVSAHKLGGPPGVGALILRDGLEPMSLQRGGGQESRRRAGTENLAGIVGFAAAIEAETDWGRVKALRDQVEAGVRACRSDALIVAEGAPRLPNTACLLVPGMAAETQLMALDLAGISVSSGAACSSGKVGPSHVLAAMGLPPEMARCAIRVSLGWSSTEADVEAFLAACRELYTRPRASRT